VGLDIDLSLMLRAQVLLWQTRDQIREETNLLTALV